MATPLRDPLSVAAPIFPENTEGASLFKTYMAAVGKAREARLKGNNKYADYTTKQLNTKIGSDWTAELSEELQPEVDKIQEDYHNYLTQDEAAHGDLTPAHQAEILARWQAVKDKAQGANGDWKILEARNAVVSKGGYDEIKSHARTGALLDPAGFLAEKSNKDIDPEFYNKVQEDYNKMKGESENGKVSPREFAARFHSDKDYDIVKETKPIDFKKEIGSSVNYVADEIGTSNPKGQFIYDEKKQFANFSSKQVQAKIAWSTLSDERKQAYQAEFDKNKDKTVEMPTGDPKNPSKTTTYDNAKDFYTNSAAADAYFKTKQSQIDEVKAVPQTQTTKRSENALTLPKSKPERTTYVKDDGSNDTLPTEGGNAFGDAPTGKSFSGAIEYSNGSFKEDAGQAVKGDLTKIGIIDFGGKLGKQPVAFIAKDGKRNEIVYVPLKGSAIDDVIEYMNDKNILLDKDDDDMYSSYLGYSINSKLQRNGGGSGTPTPNNNAAPRPKSK